MVRQQQQQQETTTTTGIEDHWNTIVAQSEHEAALAAIDSSFDAFRAAAVSVSVSPGVTAQHDDDDESPDPEKIAELYETAKASLSHHIQRVVRPVPDDEYSDYVDRYNVVLDDDDEESDDPNDEDHDDGTTDRHRNPGGGEIHDDDDDGEEQEIDDEELIDTKAWKDAQELRKRIRAMAGAVQSVRERVLKHTEQGISKSCSNHLVDRPVRIVFFDGENDSADDDDGDDDSNKNSSNNNENTGDASNDKENLVRSDSTRADILDRSLHDSLKDLTKLLRDPKWTRLPNRIQSLQETIETIQKETADDRVPSQTEIAITSRYKDTIDESARRAVFGEHSEQGDDDSSSFVNTSTAMKPMDRLALFGQLFS